MSNQVVKDLKSPHIDISVSRNGYGIRYVLPKVNSLVSNPDAERAASKADGPGIGITGIFSTTHNFACK